MPDSDPTSPASFPVWFVAARAVHLAACLLLFGLPAFDRLVARGEAEGLEAAPTRGARWLLALALSAALLSGAAWLVFVAAEMSDCPPRELHFDVVRVVWGQTHFGRLWQIRSTLWLATTAATVLLLPRPRPALAWAALLPSAGLLGSLAWAGHGLTGAGPAAPAHLPADVVHLLATGLWPTGLLPFALLLICLRRSDSPGRWVAVARLTRRFSAVATACVVLLAVTGVINSWLLVGSVPALTGTPYGRLLVGKITLFLAMLGLGAVNLLSLKPRLSAAAATTNNTTDTPADALAAHLRYNVVLEFALGTLVILLVALLGILPPAAG